LLTRPPATSQKRALALNQVLQETLDLLDPMLQDERVELEIVLDQEPVKVFGDSDQLKQVFLNLLQNAVDAMRGTGKIRVTSRRLDATVLVTIEDEGPGIPAELLEKVFDPFFTTKPEGNGLGLAISRNIIRDHGGSLLPHSAPPKGSTFTIELPLDFS
jgi:signal transduction histidine kinase